MSRSLEENQIYLAPFFSGGSSLSRSGRSSKICIPQSRPSMPTAGIRMPEGAIGKVHCPLTVFTLVKTGDALQRAAFGKEPFGQPAARGRKAAWI